MTAIYSVGFSDGSLFSELGPASDMSCFFACIRQFATRSLPQIDLTLITDRLYQRYIRQAELENTEELIRLIQDTFNATQTLRVDRKNFGLDMAMTKLDLNAGSLGDVYKRYFVAFFRCAEDAAYQFDKHHTEPDFVYEPVHIIVSELPYFYEQKGRAWNEYDALKGDPFWLTALKQQPTKQVGSFQRTKVVAGTTFIPEFTSDSGDEFVLISNHNFIPNNGFEMSVAFNRARVAHARKHFPSPNAKCMLVYDLRGQVVSDVSREQLRNAFTGLCELKLDI